MINKNLCILIFILLICSIILSSEHFTSKSKINKTQNELNTLQAKKTKFDSDLNNLKNMSGFSEIPVVDGHVFIKVSSPLVVGLYQSKLGTVRYSSDNTDRVRKFGNKITGFGPSNLIGNSTDNININGLLEETTWKGVDSDILLNKLNSC